jgi:PAS domain-containing protein
LLGVSPSQSQYKVFTQLLEKSSQDPFTQFHQEVLSGKCRRHCDVAIINQTRQTPTRVRLQAVADEEGQECRMVMIDISAGQPTQTDAFKSNAYEGLILENVPFMLWVKNKQGRFVTFNPLFAQHYVPCTMVLSPRWATGRWSKSAWKLTTSPDGTR